MNKHKLLNIILCLAIILSNFTPLFTTKVNAAAAYTVYISYPDADVLYGSYDSYSAAYTAMNNYPSTELKVAVIKNTEGRIVYAKYGIVETDYDLYNKITKNMNDEYWIKYIYSTPSDAVSGTPNTNNLLASYIPTWGADAAFLDYDVNNKAVKLKISGVVGYLALWDTAIIPISKYYNATSNYSSNITTLKALKSGINLRSTATTTGDNILKSGAITSGANYVYYPSKTVEKDGYTWYYIKYDSNTYGYVNDDGTNFKDSSSLHNDTYYYAYGNNLYHQIHMGTASEESTNIVGEAPTYYDKSGKHYFLTNSLASGWNNRSSQNYRYYSFDGTYFYDTYSKMIDDYRNNSNANAMNTGKPYYSYFMYLPSHSKTGYAASSFDNLLSSYTFPTDPRSYVNSSGGWIKNRGNASLMSGIGSTLIKVANTYGVSALTLYSSAVSESASGTSSIAFLKANLYGMGASDDDPVGKAYDYYSIANTSDPHVAVEASVVGYATSIGQGRYANIFDSVYRGTHLGNKLSGQNVYYATDPYSGESKAKVAYISDYNNGSVDYNANTLGITTNSLSSTVKVYSEPNSTSRVIYETKNYNTNRTITNLPFIVTNKVSNIVNGKVETYYKVYTDIALSSTRTIASNGNYVYSFNNCYGYIKDTDLYVANNEPVINASNISLMQYEKYDLLNGVTATDLENGTITNTLSVNENDLDINTPGTYTVTYTATDKSNYSTSKTVTVNVNPTDAPSIIAPDINITQYKTWDVMTGVTVEDINEDDLVNKVSVKNESGKVITSFTPDTVGSYKLTYTVTNALGKTSVVTRNVNVIINEKPTINVTNKVAYLNESFNYMKDVTAIDPEDGELTKYITHDEKVDTTQVGNYEVTYKVKDLDGQETTKIINVTVEAKKFIPKNGLFYLDNLTFDSKTSLIDFSGYLAIRTINNKKTDNISFDIIFENQYNGDTIIKSLSRLTNNLPFAVPNENNLDYSGSWFKEKLDLSDIPSGNYTVYVRSRNGDYETKVLLKNEYFNSKVVRKFNIGTSGYQFRINYYNRSLPLELFVREDGLIASTNNPTIDNMFNQVYSIKLNGTVLDITASSHNVNGNYTSNQTVERYIMLENISTFNIYNKTNVGSITNGPYKVNLRVSDGLDKTRVWYKTSIDLKDLPKGTYSIIAKTKTGNIDDFGELYDVLYMDSINQTQKIGDKTITIKRNENIRYRIEITVE